jgi:hypothetical protein
MLTSSLALLGASVGPWLLQIPMPEATPYFKDTIEEPSSLMLMLIGCGMLAAYGLVTRSRNDRKASIPANKYSVLTRRAA